MFTNIQSKRVQILKETLFEIYKDEYLYEYLIFKGGTSLMLFYDLPRFSEDLDFSLLPGFNKDEINIRINKVIKRMGFEIVDYDNTKHLSVGKKCYYKIDGTSYELKLEISNRPYNTKIEYQVEQLFVNNNNIDLKLLALKQNFAHKLCAFFDRNRGRDTVDIYYYLKNNSPIDENVIFERLGTSIESVFREYIKQISNIDNRKGYIREIGALVNENEILTSGYYLDHSIEMIYHYGNNIEVINKNDLKIIYDNIINNDHIYQLNKTFYVVRNNNGFVNYFRSQDSNYGIINFSDNKLLVEYNSIDDLIDFIYDNQLLFI